MIHPILSRAAQRRPRSRARGCVRLESLEGRRLLNGYTVVDLGTLGGATSEAYDINNSNQVVGRARTSAGTLHAFRFADVNGNNVADPGEMVDLAPGSAHSYAFGINAAGDAVGTTDPDADPDNRNERAVRYSGGAATDLGLGDGGNAYGINAAGAVAGGATFATSYLAYLRSPSGQVSTFLLDSPYNNYSEARGVNDSGVVVGFSGGGVGDQAFIRTADGTMTPIAFANATETYSYAWDVNNAGQVAGEGFNSLGQYRAFRYAGGTVTDLGTLPGFGSSEAYGLNAAGHVVGRAEPTTAGANHAFLYTDAAGMEDLNALIPANSGWVLTEARAINDNGYVTGFGVSPSGQVHAFLLVPAAGPSVTALSDSRDPATRSTVTLTATASNDAATVAFYRESNSQPGLQTGAGGDTLVGSDANSAGGWQVTFNKGNLAPGTYTYYAQATDDGGRTSTAGPSATTTNTVPLGGDVNLDRAVNGSDFALLAGNFGKTGQDWSGGDFNDDGAVNGSDFAILAANFGRTLPAAAAAPAAAAPAAAAPAAVSSPVRAASDADAKATDRKAPRKRANRDAPRRTPRAAATPRGAARAAARRPSAPAL